MKFLILGINGMAGHMIAQYLMEQDYEVTGFAKNKSDICNTVIGDALCMNDIKRVLASDRYDYVVNCIGVLNRFVDENLANGIYLNSVLPHLLAARLADTETKLVHISTDCVFDGSKGSYKEDDVPNAVSYYGRSKALGEVIDQKNLTIRTSIVGPELKKNGIGLFHWFMSQRQVNGYAGVIWSGVTTLQLAKAIEQDVQIKHTGLYHLTNNEKISKYALLQLFNQYCRKDKAEIKKDTVVLNDKSLCSTLGNGCFAVPSYEQMVMEMGLWIVQHPNLYGQYLI